MGTGKILPIVSRPVGYLELYLAITNSEVTYHLGTGNIFPTVSQPVGYQELYLTITNTK